MASSSSSGVADQISRLSLNPASSAQRQPTTRFLVVCGVVKIDDAWFFGNFLGFCRALMSLGVKETFWNCFPIGEYFDRGQYDNIKFGRQGSGWTPIEVYSKHNWTNRQKFWRHFSPAEMDTLVVEVISHINKMAQELVAGDIFNLVLIGHGEPTTGISLGGNQFLPTSLAMALDNFKANVRVNVVIQACHSGAFADRIQARNQPQRFVHTSSQEDQLSYSDSRSPSGRFRNSRFSGAFLRSLGFAHDPSTKDNWSLQSHIAMVAREGKPPHPAQSNPQAHQSADIGLISRFIDVLFTDYVDLSFSQANQTARRVITPTNPALPPTANTDTNMTAENLEATEGALESEFSLVNTDTPFPEDLRMVSEFYGTAHFKKNHRMVGSDLVKYGKMMADQLEGLRWRFRVQEAFWFALEALANKDLLGLEYLHSPITWNMTSPAVRGVALLLESFQLVKECVAMEGPELEGSFRAPVMWLAVLVVRCGTEIQKVFEFLVTTRILGDLDEAHLLALDKVIIPGSDYKAPEKLPAKQSEELRVYGFWLPQSFDNLQGFQRNWGKRYSRIWHVYRLCFGTGSWGDCSDIKMSIEGLN